MVDLMGLEPTTSPTRRSALLWKKWSGALEFVIYLEFGDLGFGLCF